MPQSPNQTFAEWNTLRTVDLQAVATWMIRKIIERLNKLEKAVLAALIQTDPTDSPDAADRRAALEDFEQQIEALIKAAYIEIWQRAEDDFEELADIENDERRKQLSGILDVRAKRSKLSDIMALTIMGATLEDWFSRQAGNLKFKYVTTITQGVDANENLSKLMRRVKGFAGVEDKAPVAIPRPADTAIAQAETLIRTAVEAVEQEVSERIVEKAGDKFPIGWQSIAVLDSHTTTLCRAYAWKIWDKELKPVGGHNLPFMPCPRHWYCRSTNQMILLDDDPAKEFTFKDWLASIPEKDQDKIFGKTQMKMYRAGKLTDNQLIRQQERALSLDDLRNVKDPRIPPTDE